MKFTKTLLVAVLFSSLYLTFTNAANFNVINQCTIPVWAAFSTGDGRGDGRRLDRGQSWSLDVAPGTVRARIWGRTNCNFDANGQGHCQTGDCNGRLQCQSYGIAPNTLAEFSLNQPNIDYIDISNIEGYNIPLEFSSVTPCRVIRCSAPIVDQCPAQLRTDGGCNNPCTVFKTIQYCCTIERGSCGPTDFSRFFKDRCPDSYSYPQDDQSSVIRSDDQSSVIRFFKDRWTGSLTLEWNKFAHM